MVTSATCVDCALSASMRDTIGSSVSANSIEPASFTTSSDSKLASERASLHMVRLPSAFPLDVVDFHRYTFLAGSGRSSCPFSIRLRILKLVPVVHWCRVAMLFDAQFIAELLPQLFKILSTGRP